MNFGDVLRRLLDERELTQKQLAKDLNIAPSTLGNYIRNIREPDFETVKRFALYFQVSIDYLLDFHEESMTITHDEKTLLHIYRALTPEQKAIYIEQGKVFLKQNRKDNTLK